MEPRRYRAWVRLLCAVALGFGLSGATVAAAAQTDPLHARPAIAQLHGTIHDATTSTARASLALSHHIVRRIPTTVGSALLAGGLLAGGLVLVSRRRRTSTSGDQRRTDTTGARAPPVAIGI